MAEGNNFLSIPKFDGDYDHWSMLMENLLRSKEYWSLIENGYTEPDAEEMLTTAQRKTLEDQKLKDLRAKNYLFHSIDKSILKTIIQKDTSKQLWDSMKRKYQGNVRVQRAQLQTLRREFEVLEMKTGGPKLRKWYGAPDILPKNGSSLEDDDESPEEGEVRDVVLVTDGDNEIGQMVILSLIVKRARVKALVKDKRAAIESFGTYVESVAGDANDRPFLQKALRGVRAVICPNEGFLSNVESLKGVQHVILLSQLSVYKGSSGIQAIMKSNARKLAEQDESVVTSSGIPYTIIRCGSLRNSPGGQQGFSFKEGSAAEGSLSKEDAAFICVEALDSVPEKGLIFEVVNGEEKVLEWNECFTRLMEKVEQQLL